MKTKYIFFQLCSVFVMTMLCTHTTGKTFYVDPATGSMSNDGSYNAPWSTLKEVFDNKLIESQMWSSHPVDSASYLIPKNAGAQVQAGDTLMLRTGYHGNIFVTEYYNTDYITIMAQSGHTPLLSRLNLRGGTKWRIKGLTIGADADPANWVHTNLLFLESNGWSGPITQCIVEDCFIYTVKDASGWTMQQWDTLSCNGISVKGDSCIVRNNYMKNINFAINITGNHTRVISNIVENFAGDGMRGIGNDLYFGYNTVKNCYKVNANHDDGFQSWSINTDPPRERDTLIGNIFINYEDTLQPFHGPMQGIGCFDGPYIDWVIENNVVIVDHWHGISLYGAINCRIVNNTVIDRNPDVSPGPPWITIHDHKDGTPSSGCVVRNNISTNIITGAETTADHNLKISSVDYTSLFVDYENFDLHLNPGCAAIDSGIATLAPIVDKDGNARPFGTAHDLGAYEWRFSSTIANNMNEDINAFTIYPNPSTGEITLQGFEVYKSESIDLIVYSLLGKKVHEETIDIINTNKIKRNLNDYNINPGVYLIYIKSSSYFEAKKIIISNY